MQKSLARDVYWQLRSTTRRLKDEFRKKIEDFGITWPQFHASNMTGIIDRMTENGWVYREHSEADRRVWLVKMTPEGAQLREKVIPQHQSYVERRIGVLNAEELALLQELLTKLRDGVPGEEDF